MKKLSQKQQAILEFLKAFQDRKRYSPSVREIQQACEISSTSVVDYNLRLLEAQGHIRRDREVSRGIEILEETPAGPGVRRVPLLGTIAAGEPISVPDSGGWETAAEDWVAVPDSMLRSKEDVYALRVQGTSMVKDMINDGDTVLIQHRQAAANGETVVAWLQEEKETTLKKYYREGDRIRLQPANSALKPRYVDPENLLIQGRLVGVLRDVG